MPIDIIQNPIYNVSRQFKWIETQTKNINSTTMTLSSPVVVGDVLYIVDNNGIVWTEGFNYSISGSVITFAKALPKTLTFKIINLGQ